MKIIIAGTRSYTNYKVFCYLLEEVLAEAFNYPSKIEVVCGGAKGPDKMGERWAKENGHSVKHFLPDWSKHGKGAGMVRNGDMAKYADALIAFWDGRSRGTKDMIKKADQAGLKSYTIYI